MRILATLVAVGLLLLSPSTHATERGVASWYGPRHHGKMTASGERFDQWQLTAAHRTLPFGTVVRVRNLRTNHSVIVRITDRGPYAHGRILDVSLATAALLGMLDNGIDRVEVTIVSRPSRH